MLAVLVPAEHTDMPASSRFTLALALIGAVHTAAQAAAPIPAHRLDNGSITVLASEAAGGRVLSFGLSGKANVLHVDETAGDADAPVNAATGYIRYQGHEVWVGPQKTWWTDQDVLPDRAAAKASWPPDPFLTLAPYSLMQRTPSELVVQSLPSQVTGIQLRKRYAFVKNRPNSLQLEVTATNIRKKKVVRDIWFNTRVRVDTHVYVPIAAEGDVRMQSPEGVDPIRYTMKDGFVSVDLPEPDAAVRKGKLFIQPAAGWMAGFHSAQAFIIQFPLQPRGAIHPDQGQVELYHDVAPGDPVSGMIEMEVHAPLRTLAPGRSMRASERWTVLPYDGPPTREAHLAFLRQHARHLGLSAL